MGWQRKLLGEEVLTFSKTCAIAASYELTEQQSKLFQPEPICAVYSGQHKNTPSRGIMKNTKENQAGYMSSNSKKKNACYRCGRAHDPSTCPAVDWVCYSCRSRGHIPSVCSKRGINHVEEEDVNLEEQQGQVQMHNNFEDESDENVLANLALLDCDNVPKIFYIFINKSLLGMELDT